MGNENENPGFSCPLPLARHDSILLGHGSGGRLTHDLIGSLFAPAFANPATVDEHDGALLARPPGRIAMTTDSFVVHPLFFPGGDIGSLAVHGTVNDLAMCGAQPTCLSAAFILEEGFPMSLLRQIVASMAKAAAAVGVPIVTGDTKVVERGRGDGVFINTTGVGCVADGIDISPRRVRAGDVILLSGPIAEHGVAILSVREGLRFETDIESDSAPLNDIVARLLEAAGTGVHVMRDPTRGGVASTLNEIAEVSGLGIEIVEDQIPVREEVRGACEILGLDPLYVANEGRFICFVSPASAETALEALRAHPMGREGRVIGKVVEDHPRRVALRTRIGSRRFVDLFAGELLPRIC